jgi:hypothetical protein
MKKKIKWEPIFDFNVPDWQYICIVSSVGESARGDLDILSLVYRNGGVKAILRLLFPSGRKIRAEKGYGTIDEAVEGIKKIAEEMPETRNWRHAVIWNSTTKGQDLYRAMKKSPHLELTETPIDDPS